MRNPILLLGAGLLLTVLPAAPALADGAVITPDGICGGFVPTESGEIGPAILGYISLSNTTKSGNYNITCKFDVPEHLVPPETRKASNFSCRFPDGTLADYSRMAVTTGGSGSLVCKTRG